MLAYEFIAFDRAGLQLVEIDGELDWMGSQRQFHEARFQESFFAENNFWPETNNF